MPRGGARPGAGRKRRMGETSRLQLRLDPDYLRIIDEARGKLLGADGRPFSRADFFRLAVSAYIGELTSGQTFRPAPPAAGPARAFPLELPVLLWGRAGEAVRRGLAPTLAGLVRAAGSRLAEQVSGAKT